MNELESMGREHKLIEDLLSIKGITLTVKKYKNTQLLLRKGDDIHNIKIHVSGVLSIVNEFEDGRIYAFCETSPVGFIGSNALLAGVNIASVTVIAKGDVTTIILSSADFLKWVTDSKYAALQVAIKTAKSIYPKSQNTGHILMKTRALIFLEYIYDCILPFTGKSTTIKKNREVMSNESGISIRTLNRNIKRLKELNCLTTIRGKICINQNHFDNLKDYLDSQKI